MKAVVQIPAYHEGPRLAETTEAVLSQRVPDGVAVDVEAWVTPDPDPSSCSTWATAESVDGVAVYEAPIGKLSTRNAAHSHAVTEGYDAFVTWDADAPPLHEGVLAELLVPLMENPAYPAVNSQPVTNPNGDGGISAAVVDSFARAEDFLSPHLNGQAHAIRTSAWERAGPFDTDRDETDLWEVRQEEEMGMWGRLRRLGPIPRPSGAEVFNDPRRHLCKIPGAGDPDWCDAVNMTDTRERR